MTASGVEVDVRFVLTTPEWTPIPGAVVRVVVGDRADWQDSAVGATFTTGADGGHQFTAAAVLETRRRKRPTNFWTSLTARWEVTDYLRAATELEYAGRRWLYLSAVDRFPDGASAQLDGLAVYGLDAAGRFTRAAKYHDDAWILPGMEEARLSSPGYALSELALERDPSWPGRWALRIGYQRMPEPVHRR